MTAYEQRFYRVPGSRDDRVSFTIRVKETDLYIRAASDLSARALEAVQGIRLGLESYLESRPGMLEALEPLPPDPLAPPLVRAMLEAGSKAGVGPMAAVAGAIAEAVGRDLMAQSPGVMVENGGDLFISWPEDAVVGIWAGKSPFSFRLGVKVRSYEMPVSLAVSSGTIGHSLSLGRADAALVKARNGALADACATALGNRVKGIKDMAKALDWLSGVPDVLGGLVIIKDKIAAWGDLDLTEIETDQGGEN